VPAQHMRELNEWKPCRTNPELGVASFDGMAIIADPITNPRRDRVMPLFEEEQVLMCRLILDRLHPGALVLDVGTGSGVFAVWAALERRCRVVAIDILARSILFGKRNAAANGVPVVSGFKKLVDGSIWFHRQDVADFVPLATAKLWEFDVVILNPPFSPTCPGLNPAIHASAGPRAQRPFEEQIRLAPQVQKASGYCLGYQMSYDKVDGQVGALQTIQRAYRHRCSIEYAHVLDDRHQFPVGPFLRGQYASFLDECPASDRPPGASVVRHNFVRYLRTTGRPGRFFSLIYYEVRKEPSFSSGLPIEVRLEVKPAVKWESRIALHRCIVDHTG